MHAKPTVKLIVDMDGVFANFVQSVCETHNLPSPYDNGYEGWKMEDSPEFQHMSRNQIFKPCKTSEWWENVPKTQEADSILETCLGLVDVENMVVCTAATWPMGPCLDGKIAWWKKHYPHTGLHEKVIATPHKHFLASPRSVLLDDADHNVEPFEAHGGLAVLYPRPWNKRRGLKEFDLLRELTIKVRLAELA